MTFNQAIELIRKAKPYRLIWYGFEYKNYYIFALAVDNTYIPEDTAISWYSINKDNKEISEFDYYGRLIFDEEYDLGEASKNKVLVDITEEQLV